MPHCACEWCYGCRVNGNMWVHDVQDVPDVPTFGVLICHICHDWMMVSEILSGSEMVPRKETKLKTTEAKELKEEQEAKQAKAAQKTSGTQEAEGKQVGLHSQRSDFKHP